MDDRKYAILYKFSFITEIAIELIFWHLKKITVVFLSLSWVMGTSLCVLAYEIAGQRTWTHPF